MRIPWKLVFPAIAGALTLELRHLDRLWLIGSGKWDDMAVTTASGLIMLVNGPFCFVLANLVGDFIFALIWWSSLGWLLDRKLRGAPHLIKTGWARAATLSIGLAISSTMLCLLLVHIRFAGIQRYLPFILAGPFPRRLLGRETALLAGVLWSTGFTIYFALKLRSMIAQRVAKLTNSHKYGNIS